MLIDSLSSSKGIDMSDEIIDAEVIESTDDVDTAAAGIKVDEILITITEANASYNSSLPPHEIVFWLDIMKHMILSNLLSGTAPNELTNSPN